MFKGLGTITMTIISALLLLFIEFVLHFAILLNGRSFLFVCFFKIETRYYASQADLKLAMQLRVTLNF